METLLPRSLWPEAHQRPCSGPQFPHLHRGDVGPVSHAFCSSHPSPCLVGADGWLLSQPPPLCGIPPVPATTPPHPAEAGKLLWGNSARDLCQALNYHCIGKQGAPPQNPKFPARHGIAEPGGPFLCGRSSPATHPPPAPCPCSSYALIFFIKESWQQQCWASVNVNSLITLRSFSQQPSPLTSFQLFSPGDN